jgi:hypothetical protein
MGLDYVAQVAEHLPGKPRALSSNFSTKERKRERERERENE